MELSFGLMFTVVSEIVKSFLSVTWMEWSFGLIFTVASEIVKSFLLKKNYTYSKNAPSHRGSYSKKVKILVVF